MKNLINFTFSVLVCISSASRFSIGAPPFPIASIATFGTPAPGGSGLFSSFSLEVGSDPVPPALDSGDISFSAYDASNFDGIYRYHLGTLSLVLNQGTFITGTTIHLSHFAQTSISGEQIAFRASNGNPFGFGIYLASHDSIIPIADNTITVPGRATNFTGAGRPTLDDGDVSFFGEPAGIYRYRGGSLTVIADTTTTIPSGTGTFSDLSSEAHGTHGSVAFWGRDASLQRGIYLASASGELSVVADTTTTIPGSNDHFASFSNIVIASDGSDVAFVGTDQADRTSLFQRLDGKLRVIAQARRPAPGGGTFGINDLSQMSLDSGHIAFQAGLADTFDNAIFTNVRGDLERVVSTGDTVDGRTISYLWLGPDALSGNSLAFVANFTDGTQGILLATLPEPITLSVFLPLLLLLRRSSPSPVPRALL